MTRYISLRWKLAALIAGGSLLTAIIASAGFAWLDWKRFGGHTRDEVSAIGAVVADQIGPALALHDRKAAAELLASLHRDPRVRDAALFDSAGACFAAFQRSGEAGCPVETHYEIDLTLAVQGGGEQLGTLLLSANVPSVWMFLNGYLGGAALILGLSLLVAAAVAMTLQARVSKPILEIAGFAARMANTHRFEDRLELESTDEVAVLAESFNAMLHEIEKRDDELGKHRHALEEEIAERKRVNDELRVAKDKAEEAARLKSEFLANMSHEIRTPMNGVIGMISLSLDGCLDPQLREQLQVAQDAAQSLVVILNDILDLSKIEVGKMTLEAIEFELEGLLHDTLRIFDIAVASKHLEMRVAIAPQCPRVLCGDPVRLRQIIVNLVGNAVKFTQSGSVTVKVGLGETRAGTPNFRFEVADTGIGIPPEKLGVIFDAFTQADGSHTRKFGGTGLGLTITRRLVDLMSGTLWATSEVGHGSTFVAELPLTVPPAPVLGEAGAASSAFEAQLPMLRVLVAEDNLINQKVISAMLTRQGWKLTLASNGREAFECYRHDSFDLILMDIQMPEADGIEATRMIRQHEKSRAVPVDRRIPIIALTANASPAEHQQFLAAGMDAVTTKPVNLAGLLRAVATCLADHQVPVVQV